MAAMTAFWNRRGVVGSQPTDPQLNSFRESADTGNYSLHAMDVLYYAFDFGYQKYV